MQFRDSDENLPLITLILEPFLIFTSFLFFPFHFFLCSHTFSFPPLPLERLPACFSRVDPLTLLHTHAVIPPAVLFINPLRLLTLFISLFSQPYPDASWMCRWNAAGAVTVMYGCNPGSAA